MFVMNFKSIKKIPELKISGWSSSYYTLYLFDHFRDNIDSAFCFITNFAMDFCVKW